MKLSYSSILPFSVFGFWKAYFVQMRPYLLYVSGIAGLSGMAMGTNAGTSLWKMLAFIPFFLGYGFGQALTDCFQTDTDKLSAPYRPLSRGVISISSVLIVSITGLCFSGLILYFVSFDSFLLCVLSVIGLASYSYVKKHFWVAGPFHNAWIVALLPMMGYFTVEHVKGFPSHFSSYIALTFFSYASFVLIGYLKDTGADKATGYKTFPVVFGWDKTIIAGDLFAIVSLALFWWHGDKNIYEIIAGGSASIILLKGQLYGHFTKRKNEKAALYPILSTVKSFILFHIAIVVHFQSQWWLVMLIYYVFFEIALYRRPARYQV